MTESGSSVSIAPSRPPTRPDFVPQLWTLSWPVGGGTERETSASGEGFNASCARDRHRPAETRQSRLFRDLRDSGRSAPRARPATPDAPYNGLRGDSPNRRLKMRLNKKYRPTRRPSAERGLTTIGAPNRMKNGAFY